MEHSIGLDSIYHVVYKITNKVNGKIYIGKHSTANLNDPYLGSGDSIEKAKVKYGLHSFTKEILSTHDTSDEAYAEEARIVTIDFIKRRDNYNKVPGGKGPTLGMVVVKDGDSHKVVTKEEFDSNPNLEATSVGYITAKLSTGGPCFKVKKDDPRWETGEIVGNRAGYVMTEEMKSKFTRKGLTNSEEHRRKISEGNKGKTLSEEHKKSISEKLTGTTLSEERKKKISSALKGKTHSLESIEKMRSSHLGKTQKIVTCPHCGETGGASNMKIWHFDNCKFKVS